MDPISISEKEASFLLFRIKYFYLWNPNENLGFNKISLVDVKHV